MNINGIASSSAHQGCSGPTPPVPARPKECTSLPPRQLEYGNTDTCQKSASVRNSQPFGQDGPKLETTSSAQEAGGGFERFFKKILEMLGLGR